jgi:hypothetical protein
MSGRAHGACCATEQGTMNNNGNHRNIFIVVLLGHASPSISSHLRSAAVEDLILFRDVLSDICEKVATLKKQGKTLAEIVATKPGARTDDEWGNGFWTPAKFVGSVYEGV